MKRDSEFYRRMRRLPTPESLAETADPPAEFRGGRSHRASKPHPSRSVLHSRRKAPASIRTHGAYRAFIRGRWRMVRYALDGSDKR